MTNNELKWLETQGKIGACSTCLFRKHKIEMDTELLPCNQYQCLVKLYRSDMIQDQPQESLVDSRDTTSIVVDNNTPNETNPSEQTQEPQSATRTRHNRRGVPATITSSPKVTTALMGKDKLDAKNMVDDDFLKQEVGKVYGNYKIIAYESKEQFECTKEAGYIENRLTNRYTFKVKCLCCGSIHTMFRKSITQAAKNGQLHCNLCKNKADYPTNLFDKNYGYGKVTRWLDSDVDRVFRCVAKFEDGTCKTLTNSQYKATSYLYKDKQVEGGTK